MDILIVEEISMLGGEYFEKIEEMAGKIRGGARGKEAQFNRPWGDLQIILCGVSNEHMQL